MDSSNLLEDIGSNIKIEAESDSVFFGLNSAIMTTPDLPSTLLRSDGGRDMDSHSQDETSIVNSFLASDIGDLDFDLLQDLPLPVDDLSLLDDILMNDDSSSNSFSPESFVLDSIADSPPSTPPSPTYSSSSSSSQLGRAEIKFEALSPCSVNGQMQTDMVDNINQAKSNVRSARGRSASIEAPEVQALKRHIRMIRNRESACLSRKKKKDYMTSVENRVKELETENAQLKLENTLLKKRLHELGQSVNKNAAAVSTRAPPRILVATPPAKTGPAPKIIKINTKLPATAAKIVLLGFCCFMFVTFRPPTSDIGNSTTNSTHVMSKIMINSEDLMPSSFHPPASRRSSSVYETERHADHNDDFTLPNLPKGQRKHGLWDNIRVDENYLDKNESSLNGTLSGTGNSTSPRVDTIHHRKLSKSGRADSASKSEQVPKYANETLGMDNCALFNQTEALKVQNRLKGIFGKRPESIRRRPVPVHKPIVYSLIDSSPKLNDNKGLTVYDEKLRQYSKVFDQLERREDTYYVISLAIENQLLFSAKAHNITSRPKMSFLLPWRNETRGGKEELMQIDCEVTGVFTLNKPTRNS